MNNNTYLNSDFVPVEIIEAANRATLNLLPTKSRQQYNIAYSRFVEWCILKKNQNYGNLQAYGPIIP